MIYVSYYTGHAQICVSLNRYTSIHQELSVSCFEFEHVAALIFKNNIEGLFASPLVTSLVPPPPKLRL
jgi:hypothetical protein